MHLVRAVGQSQRRGRPRRRPPAGSRRTGRRAPCSWMAMSITSSAMVGTATLICDTSLRAPASPLVSSSHAVCSTSSRAWLIAMRAFAIRSRLPPRFASGLPNATRSVAARARQLQRPLGQPDQPHAVVDPPGAEAALGDLETAAGPGDHRRQRQPHVGEADLAVAERLVAVAEHRQHPLDLRRPRRPSAPAPSSAAVPVGVRVGEAHEDDEAAVRVADAGADHHFRPLRTISSPLTIAVAAMFVASEDATPGSVMQNADRISPRSSGFQPPLLLLGAAVLDAAPRRCRCRARCS